MIGSSGELLAYDTTRNAATPMPADGMTYRWVTNDHVRVACLASIDNHTGQGFLAVTPDGTKYWFKHMAQYFEPTLESVLTTAHGNYTNFHPRRTNVLYATRVEDRFGNWVTYTYANAWNAPGKLTAIQSSDGRQLTIAYSGSRIASVSDGTRTWSYAYGTTPGKGRATLKQVTLPDASKWIIEFNQFTDAEIEQTEPNLMVSGEIYRTCKAPEIPLNIAQQPAGSITHPSGATGSFTLGIAMHGRSNVPLTCGHVSNGHPDYLAGNNPNDDINLFTLRYYALTLLRKQLSGPAIDTATWQYTYSPNTSWFLPGNATNQWPVCTSGAVCYQPDPSCAPSCPGASLTTVTGPNGEWTRYSHGNSFRYNEGKLLRVDRGSGVNDILDSVVYDYDFSQADQQYPASYGDSLKVSYDGFASQWHRPLVRVENSRQGEAFTWEVADGCLGGAWCFDEFAQPTRIDRHSSLGFSRTEATRYLNDVLKWVIGLPEAVTCLQAAPADDLCDGDDIIEEVVYTTSGQPGTRKAFGKLQHTLSYNADGTLKTFKDGRNNTTTLSSWYRGVPRSIAYVGGVSRLAEVNPTGTIASTTDENGHKTCYRYDQMGRLDQVTYPSESQLGVCDSTAWNRTTFSFAKLAAAENGIPAGHWRHATTTGTGHSLVYFDALWRPMATLEHDSAAAGTVRWVQTKFDHAGRNIFTSYSSDTSGSLSGTRTSYDPLGRVTKVEQDSELGILTTTTSYPKTAFEVTVVNPRGFQVTTTAFQAWDQPTTAFPVAISHPESVFTAVTRNAFGKPRALTRSGGSTSVTRSYDYNAHHELCRQVEPETGATLMGYDAAGNLAWSASGLPESLGCDANPAANPVLARKAMRTYDGRNRLLTLTFPDGLSDQVWTYAPDGLPETITTYNNYGHLANRMAVITAYAYNARRMLAGQGESVHQENSYTWGFGYGYDRNGHLAANTYPSGLSVNYAPNALGQPTQVGGYVTGVVHHPNGAVAELVFGNGIHRVVEQNVRGLPYRIQDTKPGGGDVFDDFHYYDQNGNVVALTDGAGGRAQRGNRDMTYDGLDRLRTVTWPMQTATASYAYDALDNLTRVVTQSPTAVHDRDHHYCYDGTNRLTNIKVGGCGGATVGALGYDLQGNVQNKDGTGYHFDYANRLRKVGHDLGTSTEAVIESYRYDGLGRRVQSRTDTGARVLSQYSRDGRLVSQYDHRTSERIDFLYLGTQLVATRTRPVSDPTYTTEYQHADALGSAVVATNSSGNRLRYDEYEAYGLRTNRPNDNRPGYTGHVMDDVTGLTYMQQRYYDPEIGMFLSVDPVTAYSNPVGQFHRYRYANNSPYRFTDPDGRRACPEGIRCIEAPSTRENPATPTPISEGARRENEQLRAAGRGRRLSDGTRLDMSKREQAFSSNAEGTSAPVGSSQRCAVCDGKETTVTSITFRGGDNAGHTHGAGTEQIPGTHDVPTEVGGRRPVITQNTGYVVERTAQGVRVLIIYGDNPSSSDRHKLEARIEEWNQPVQRTLDEKCTLNC